MTPPADVSPTWRPSKEDLAVMILLSYISFLAALDSTILVTILPIIAHTLRGTTNEAFWAGTSYLLTSAVSQPFIARLANSFGLHRVLLWISILVFTGASIICALSQSFTSLLTGRFLQGVGGGGMITLVQATFAGLVPLRQRPQWFSMVLGAWAIGAVIGPFIGSSLLKAASFHWVFWINVPLGTIALGLIPVFVPHFASQMPWDWRRVDWVGLIVFISSTTSLLLGLSWGGVTFAWTSQWTLLPITLGSFGCIGFGIWEHYFARYPFLPESLFGSRVLVAGYFCAFLQGLILFCILYYIPFYFASAQRQNPTQASVCILPISCSLLPGAAVVSQLISHTGHYRWALFSGWTITTIGSGLLLLLDESSKASIWVAIFLILGIGNGFLLSAINFSIQVNSGPRDSAITASMYTFFRSFGMAVGVTVGGNVFQNRMAHHLRDSGLLESIAKSAEAYVEELTRMTDSNPILYLILKAYVGGFHGVFYLLLSVAAIGLSVNILIDRYGVDNII